MTQTEKNKKGKSTCYGAKAERKKATERVG